MKKRLTPVSKTKFTWNNVLSKSSHLQGGSYQQKVARHRDFRRRMNHADGGVMCCLIIGSIRTEALDTETTSDREEGGRR